MNETALAQFIQITFMPFVPLLAGAVIALIAVVLLLILFRGFLPPEE